METPVARKVFLWALAMLCESPLRVCVYGCVLFLIEKAVIISRNEEVKNLPNRGPDEWPVESTGCGREQTRRSLWLVLGNTEIGRDFYPQCPTVPFQVSWPS